MESFFFLFEVDRDEEIADGVASVDDDSLCFLVVDTACETAADALGSATAEEEVDGAEEVEEAAAVDVTVSVEELAADVDVLGDCETIVGVTEEAAGPVEAFAAVDEADEVRGMRGMVNLRCK